ncbi:unnamed protein product [Rhizophagus irregularis]|nr:unnamed protein product [Rhizophagus irregularis]
MINFSSSLEKIFTHCRGIMVDIPGDTANIKLKPLENRSHDINNEKIIIKEIGGEELSPFSDFGIGIIEMKSKDKDQDEDERKWRNWLLQLSSF